MLYIMMFIIDIMIRCFKLTKKKGVQGDIDWLELHMSSTLLDIMRNMFKLVMVNNSADINKAYNYPHLKSLNTTKECTSDDGNSAQKGWLG